MGINKIQYRAVEQSSRVKQGISTIPSFIPKNFFEQIQFKDGAVYIHINGSWVKATTPRYMGTLTVPATGGDVSYTGIGFKPKMIKTTLLGNDTTSSGGMGYGYATSTSDQKATCLWMSDTNSSSKIAFINSVISSPYKHPTTGVYPETATLKSFDDDGFTLTWKNYAGSETTMYTTGDIIYEVMG